jgi:hypothetical protein
MPKVIRNQSIKGHRVTQGIKAQAHDAKKPCPIQGLPCELPQFSIVPFLDQKAWHALRQTCRQISSLSAMRVTITGVRRKCIDLDKIINNNPFIEDLNVTDARITSSTFKGLQCLKSLRIATSHIGKLPPCPNVSLLLCSAIKRDFTFHKSTTNLCIIDSELPKDSFKDCKKLKKLELTHHCDDLDFTPITSTVTSLLVWSSRGIDLSAFTNVTNLEIGYDIDEVFPVYHIDSIKTVTFHDYSFGPVVSQFTNATKMCFTQTQWGHTLLDDIPTSVRHVVCGHLNLKHDDMVQECKNSNLNLFTLNGMPVA